MHKKIVLLMLMLIPIPVRGSQTGLNQFNDLVPCWMKKNIKPLVIVAAGIGIFLRWRKSSQTQQPIVSPTPKQPSPALDQSPHPSEREFKQTAAEIATLDNDNANEELLYDEEEEDTQNTQFALPNDILEQQQALGKATTDKETIGQQFGIATGAGGATALMLLYRQNIPEQIAKNLRNRPPTRTGLELGAALSGAGSVLSPFVQPIGCLLLAAFCWSRFKSMILEPYKLKHQQELEKFTELLNRHKREIGQEFEKLTKKTQQDLLDANKDIEAFEKAQNTTVSKLTDDLYKELEKLKKANDAAVQTVSRQTALVLADQSEQNKKLREQIEQEHNDLLARLAGVMQGHGADLVAIKDSHATLSETNQQLKAKLDSIMPAMRQLMELTAKIRESSEQTRLAARSLGSGAGASAGAGAGTTSPRLRSAGPGNGSIKGTRTEKKRA